VDAQFIRLIRVDRYLSSFDVIGRVIRRYYRDLLTAYYVFTVIVLMGGCFSHYLEPDVVTTIPEGLYWSVITVTTIGYGDISLKTPTGRALTVFLALFGMIFAALPAGLFGTVFALRRYEDRALRRYKNMVATVVQTAWRMRHARDPSSAAFQRLFVAAVKHRRDVLIEEEATRAAAALAGIPGTRANRKSRSANRRSGVEAARECSVSSVSKMSDVSDMPSSPSDLSLATSTMALTPNRKSVVGQRLKQMIGRKLAGGQVDLSMLSTHVATDLYVKAETDLRAAMSTIMRLRFYSLLKKSKFMREALENEHTVDDVMIELESMFGRVANLTDQVGKLRAEISELKKLEEERSQRAVRATAMRAQLAEVSSLQAMLGVLSRFTHVATGSDGARSRTSSTASDDPLTMSPPERLADPLHQLLCALSRRQRERIGESDA
jgi:hypothetical protein